MSSLSVTRWRVPLGFLTGFIYLAFVIRMPSLSIGPLIVSGILIAAGCGIRAWAAGYLLKGKRLAVGGPYAYVRNPLYLGSFIIGLGFCAALWQTPLPLPVLLFWALFILGFFTMYVMKSQSEEKELIQTLGQEYARYAKQVPLFIPIRGHVNDLGVQQFSWELYRRNREYQCLLGSLVFLVLLILKTVVHV